MKNKIKEFLKNMQKNDYNIEEILINIPQAANLLHIASHTLRVWLCKDKVLPKNLVIKLGGRTLIHKQKLVDWINNNCKTDIETPANQKGGKNE